MAIISKAMTIAELETDISENESSMYLGTFVDHDQVSDWAQKAVALT